MSTVVLAGTLDTKGKEYKFVKDCLQNTGVNIIIIDVGVLEEPLFKPDINSASVAKAAGSKLEEIRFTKEGSNTRAKALDTMGRGLGIILNELYKEGKCDGVMGMGGSGGTNILSQAMSKLPLGIPKLIVSTMMAGNVKSYVNGRDLTMMYSVTDIAGLNRVSRKILANAAHSIAGMAKRKKIADKIAGTGDKPLVGLTMFGITTAGVLKIRENLENAGFETIIFHAVGSGGKAMERMIDEGLIDGVIDCTLAELCDEKLGGIFSAGPDRLTSAGQKGVPQLVIPGAIEVLNFGARDTLPQKYDVPERKLIVHNPTVCAVKANKKELKELGEEVANKLNDAKGLTKVLLPLGGIDKYEQQGGPWYNPESDKILFDAIQNNLNSSIPSERVKGNINDMNFADYAAETFIKMWEEYRSER